MISIFSSENLRNALQIYGAFLKKISKLQRYGQKYAIYIEELLEQRSLAFKTYRLSLTGNNSDFEIIIILFKSNTKTML